MRIVQESSEINQISLLVRKSIIHFFIYPKNKREKETIGHMPRIWRFRLVANQIQFRLIASVLSVVFKDSENFKIMLQATLRLSHDPSAKLNFSTVSITI